jgi:macrolide transport system ATP-binding/permease protein
VRALNRSFARLRKFASNRRGDARLREEMEVHLAMQTEENIRAGMPPEQAHREALLKMGAVEAVREHYHAEEGLPVFESLLQDVRYALRQLSRSPGFTLVALLTLALGIGANAAIFSLIDAVLMRRLPVTDPASLVRIGDHYESGVGYGVPRNADYSVFSTDAWEQLRKNSPEFQDLAAMESGADHQNIVVRRGGSQQPALPFKGEFVSGNYFQMFGLSPAIGRLFTDADNRDGAPPTAVMSYENWKNRYAADPAIIGEVLYVNSRPLTVVGVAPQGFFGDRLSATPPDFYLPIESAPLLANASWVHDPTAYWLDLIGRVKSGVPLPQLQQKLNSLLRQALAPTETFADAANKPLLSHVHVVLTPGGAGIREMRKQYSSQLYLLMSVAGLVLLIACANLANLLLVRGMSRKTELSVRCALGARRLRLIRQLLTESLILAMLGGLAGIAVAYLGTRILLALVFPDASNMPIHASPSPTVLIFAVVLSIATGILFGVAPALIAARAEPIDALRTGSRSVTGSATLLQRGLVVAQIGLSLVLLIAAGLFAQSLSKLQHTDLKLESRNRYIVHIDPQAAGYVPSRVGDLYRSIEEQFHATPGVLKVGISSYTPMEDTNSSWSVLIQGQPDLNVQAAYVKANPEYFDSVGTHTLLGRGIEPQDTPTSTAVAVVNQSFVKNLFKPGENPIGHHFGTGPESAGDYEIVGVVEDTVYTNVRMKNHAMYFLPLLQRAPSDKTPIDLDDDLYAGTIVLDAARSIGNMESLVQHTLASINPNLAVVKFETLDRQIADQFSDDRMVARLTEFFSVLALLLAVVGIYGVTAYTVSRRTGEIGIRMALGAGRFEIVAMIVRGALMQLLFGVAIGLPVAILCARFVEAILYDVKGVDITVMVVAVSTLMLAACTAGLIPARRAASVDPVRALRSE